MGTITETLSRWASGLRYEDLTPEAIDAAKHFLYDSVGCALGGYQTHDPKLVLAGRDPQLERAVDEVMQRIAADPRRLPERPAPPVKTK